MSFKAFLVGVPGQVVLEIHADKVRDKERDHVMRVCTVQWPVLMKPQIKNKALAHMNAVSLIIKSLDQKIQAVI